jgi:hypothetical protein
LALDNPLNDPDGILNKVLRIIDIVMTLIFISEILMKIVAFGALINGPKSFFRNGWNFLDMSIVVISVNILTFINILCR